MEDISTIYQIIKKQGNLSSNIANCIQELSKVSLRLKRTKVWEFGSVKDWYKKKIYKFKNNPSNLNIESISKLLRKIESKLFEAYIAPFNEAGDNISDLIAEEDNFDLKLLKTMEKNIKRAVFHDNRLQDLNITITLLLQKLENYYLPPSIYIEFLLKNLLTSENNQFADSEYIWDVCCALFYDTQTYLDHQRINIICHNFQYSPLTRINFTPELFPKNLVLRVSSPLNKYQTFKKIGEDCLFMPLRKEITISSFGYENSPRFCQDRLVIGGRFLNDASELDILMDPEDQTINHYQFLIICASDGYYLIDISSSPNLACVGVSINSTVLVENMMLRLGNFKIIEVMAIAPKGDSTELKYLNVTGVPKNLPTKMILAKGESKPFIRGHRSDPIEGTVSSSQGNFTNNGLNLVYSHTAESTLSWLLLKNYEEYTKGLPSKPVKLEGNRGIICINSCQLFYEIK